MSHVKERLFDAIAAMSEADALRLWDIVETLAEIGWDSIEEVEPDEIDLQMIHDAENDPDCKVFATEEEVKALFD